MSLPNRHKWDGWVTLVWIIAALACIAAVILISHLGTMRIPERDVLGNISWTTEPNIAVWAAAIGQAGAGVLFAVLFSMVNSIYKNSCDQLSPAASASQKPAQQDASTDSEADQKAVPPPSGNGILLRRVGMASPLEGVLQPGFRLLSINNTRPADVTDAEESVIDGENTIVFLNRSGERVRRTLHMKPGPLHLTANM